MKLIIRNLSKRYSNGVQALAAVSLTVPPGMFGLPGPNGAGKSTLMRTSVKSGENRLTLVVAGEPAKAGIDPLNKLIDRDIGDNMVDVARP